MVFYAEATVGYADDVSWCLAGNTKRQLSPKDKQTDGKALVELADGVATVKATDGKARKYNIRVLQMMLVKLYKFTSEKVHEMCLGLGLDPRKRPNQRMQSCDCGGEMSDPFHAFPKGFTFSVVKQYDEFAKKHAQDLW